MQAGNPDRIASNIATGIGFVGAGVIFKGDIGVNGITTAAMIWVTAALGMGIGAGYEWVSVMGCVLILIMLFVFGLMENGIDRVNQMRNYKIVVTTNRKRCERYEKCFNAHHLKFNRGREVKNGDSITGEWIVRGSQKNHLALINEVLQDPEVSTFEYYEHDLHDCWSNDISALRGLGLASYGTLKTDYLSPANWKKMEGVLLSDDNFPF